MGCVDVDAHSDAIRRAVQGGTEGTQGLGQDHRGAAVEQSVGLLVPGDGHRAHDALGRDLDDLDPHLLVERTTLVAHLGDQVLRVSHGPIL